MALRTILTKIKSLFAPKERSIYVVKEGQYKGEWLVPVAFGPGITVCYSLPDKYIREIPNTEIESGLQNKVLDLVDILPKDVYNVCLEDYKQHLKKQNDNPPDRRQQHSSQSVLDRKQHRKTSN
jgi:hypothetical protein